MSAAPHPLGLTGSASGWTMSYTPGGDSVPGDDGTPDAGAKLPRAPGPVIAPVPVVAMPAPAPDDPSEGVAFALWNEGRREEAIAFLERQIALQKKPDPVSAPPPTRRFRLPLKTGMAAIMLLGISGALWGGLNPSGADLDTRKVATADRPVEAADEEPAERTPLKPVRVADADAEPADVRPVSARPVTPTPAKVAARPPVTEQAAVERSSRPQENNLREQSSEGGLAALIPEPNSSERANSEPPPEDLPGDSLAGQTEGQPEAEIALPGSEPRLPKPRPNYSTGEAMALLRPEPAPARAAPPPAPPLPEVLAPVPPPPERIPRYGPQNEPMFIIVNPHLAERRALAESYIARRRARSDPRVAAEYAPIYFEFPPPYPY